jgi:ribonuclease HII
LDLERQLLRDGANLVAGVDEVGRGALAGPVTIGIVLVTHETAEPPVGLRDSKLLTAKARASLVPRISSWAVAAGVAHASASEVDKLGIIGALRLATHRGILAVQRQHQLAKTPVDVILLDGTHDWLSGPAAMAQVVTRVKGDQHCASVAAGSVIAKQERDSIMADLAPKYPGYQWEKNKGYASAEHMAAIAKLGPSRLHRHSWNLPT